MAKRVMTREQRWQLLFCYCCSQEREMEMEELDGFVAMERGRQGLWVCGIVPTTIVSHSQRARITVHGGDRRGIIFSKQLQDATT